jgi:predicted TIM-barrel fold metal-dependent hydrolase
VKIMSVALATFAGFSIMQFVAFGQALPAVDHHQHLFSPAISALLSEGTVSPVTPPRELDELIAARARANRDITVLEQLYTSDAVMLRSNSVSWIRGADSIVGWWKANQNAGVLRLTPVAALIDGTRGHIAAYITTGPVETPRHVAQVLLSVAKGPSGSWRIAAEALATSGPTVVPPIPATTLISLLDAANIQSAAVLSVAYIFGSPAFSFSDEYERVKAENDWTSQQVAAYPQRLRGFCSFNPLKDYALAELSRCANDPHLRTGLKLHFASSGVDLKNPEHVAKVRQVFRAANDLRMAIVVHLRTSPPRTYGAEEARIFLNQIIPAAPDVPVQIAHLAGSGPGYNDPRANEALSVFADAVAAKAAGTSRLLFDVTTRIDLNISRDDARLAVAQMRKIGLDRILFGSDAAIGGNLPPRQAWAAFRQLPLSEDEFRMIANNVAPYMR